MVRRDERNIVLRYDDLPLDEVLDVLRAKPADTHVAVTGRNAKDELIEIADLVSELEVVKHPFRSGVNPQAGIEFRFTCPVIAWLAATKRSWAAAPCLEAWAPGLLLLRSSLTRCGRDRKMGEHVKA